MVDSVGLITARSGSKCFTSGELKLLALSVTVSSGGVITSGIVTATSFNWNWLIQIQQIETKILLKKVVITHSFWSMDYWIQLMQTRK